MVSVKSEVKNFALVAFLLLGVLFGMIIMTFIFGQLGPSAGGLTAGSEAYNVSEQIQNNSLQAIKTYSEQSDTQFLTIAITITLVVLLALFLLFWKIFGGRKKASSSGGAFG